MNRTNERHGRFRLNRSRLNFVARSRLSVLSATGTRPKPGNDRRPSPPVAANGIVGKFFRQPAYNMDYRLSFGKKKKRAATPQGMRRKFHRRDSESPRTRSRSRCDSTKPAESVAPSRSSGYDTRFSRGPGFARPIKSLGDERNTVYVALKLSLAIPLKMAPRRLRAPSTFVRAPSKKKNESSETIEKNETNSHALVGTHRDTTAGLRRCGEASSRRWHFQRNFSGDIC